MTYQQGQLPCKIKKGNYNYGGNMKDYTKSMENFIAVDIETTGLNPEQDHV